MTDTAPRSPRIERFEKEAADDAAAALAALNADRAAAGGPIIEPADDATKVLVTFVIETDRSPVSINCQLFPLEYNSATPGYPMARVDGTDVWYATALADARVSTTYSFLVEPPATPTDMLAVASDKEALGRYMNSIADAMASDPYNPDTMVSQIALANAKRSDIRDSIVTLPKADPYPWWDEPPATGALHQERFASTILSNERNITIYTPPGYDAGAGPYRVVVLLDGEAMVGVARVDRILDNLVSGGHIEPTVALIVHNVDTVSRMFEMACSTPFANLIADELLPWVRERYAVTADPAGVAVGGASYGGLASDFIGFARPDAIGNVISMSASMWFGEMVDGEAGWLTRQFANAPTKPVRFWVDVGTLESMNIPVAAGLSMVTANRHFRDVLRAKDYEIVGYREQPGGHDIANWRRTLPEALLALFGRDA